FLAALLLLLQDDGKLNLDDKVARWLPDVTGANTMTVRQLLSHTSGLQDFWPQDYLFSAMETPVEPAGIVSRWGRKPLDYAPGTRWQYSNTGYVVAGLIAEKAGGKPLWQQFEQRLFRPLGIHPFRIDETNGPAFPQGYHRNALGPVRPATPPARGWLWAAGELSMTAAELARWDMARMNGTLLPRKDWETMETPIRLADGTTNGYGLGVSKRLVKGRWVVDHGGESVGFLSQNSTYPDDGIAIVVLTNADFAGVQNSLTDKIAGIVLPKAVQTDVAEAARDEDARATLAELAAGKLDPALFTDNARYYFTAQTLGDYASSLSPLGTPLEVKATGKPRLRGGFVNRNFSLSYKDGETLTLITYAEPGEHGRWEQFIVTPG
ncbi:MAG: beta-lactamase family protein, partial [Sphingomonadales bacterium]|nr:beta-lactamase family protein [Sphingomonadales bacterium]